jgi:hypothetical protein
MSLSSEQQGKKIMDQPSGRPPRIDVRYPAVLMRSNGDEQNVFVTDVSAGGFSLEGQDGLLVGEQVFLKLGKQVNVQAEIKWTAGSKAGGVLFGTPELE